MNAKKRLMVASGTTALALAFTLSSCTAVSESQGCGARAAFDTPQSVADAADAVALGEVVGADSQMSTTDEIASSWSVNVEKWTKGDGEKNIAVLVAPDKCHTPEDDTVFSTLKPDEQVYVFLSKTDGKWWAVDAGKGAVPAGPDGSMPDNWP